MTSLITVSESQIQQLLDPEHGAIIVQPRELQYSTLRAWAQPLLPQFQNPPPSELVSNYSYTCLGKSTNIVWRNFASILADELNRELLARMPVDEVIFFDDLYLTLYPESPMGVGPHRDTNCKGLVLSYVVQGQLPFYVCGDKQATHTTELIVNEGEILIMRADRVGTLPRPYHFVGEVKSPVLQFGLRQYINPNT